MKVAYSVAPDGTIFGHCEDMPRCWAQARTLGQARARIVQCLKAEAVAYAALDEAFVPHLIEGNTEDVLLTDNDVWFG